MELLDFCLLLPIVSACVPTIGSGKACARCTPSMLTKVAASPPNTFAITKDELFNDPTTGCIRRRITCTTDTQGQNLILQWNDGAEGTTQGTIGTSTVTDTLTCAGNGLEWLVTHTNDGQSGVNKVSCQLQG